MARIDWQAVCNDFRVGQLSIRASTHSRGKKYAQVVRNHRAYFTQGFHAIRAQLRAVIPRTLNARNHPAQSRAAADFWGADTDEKVSLGR